MPDPPPVTTATFPLRLNKVSQAWKYYTLQLKSTNSVYFIGKVARFRRGVRCNQVAFEDVEDQEEGDEEEQPMTAEIDCGGQWS
jgi:hypothetical protein